MRYKNLIILLLLVAALLPYFLLCFYALPYADDFCTAWTASEKITFAGKFLKQYLYWNGRYSSNVLSNLHPLITGKLLVYQISLFASLLLTLGAFFSLIYQFTKTVYTALITALFATLFYLCYLPDITEGVYWYMGIANYQLGNICFVFQLALFIQILLSEKNNIFIIACALLLLIISTGFNEIGAVLIPAFYLLATIIAYWSKAPKRALIVLFSATALVASGFVILSPGNAIRSSEFSDRFGLLHSLIYAGLQTVRFIAKWILSVPFVGLNLLILIHADKIQTRFVKQFDYRIILLLLLGTVFMGSFLPYLAMGILGQHRTINYVFFYFIILWIWFLISVSRKFSLAIFDKSRIYSLDHSFLRLPAPSNSQSGRTAPLQKRNSPNYRRNLLYKTFDSLHSNSQAIAIACIVFMLVSATGRNIIYDFGDDKFSAYRNGFMVRQGQMMAHPDLPIEPLRDVPRTFKITDARIDSTWWVNKCMKKFYSETGMEIK